MLTGTPPKFHGTRDILWIGGSGLGGQTQRLDARHGVSWAYLFDASLDIVGVTGGHASRHEGVGGGPQSKSDPLEGADPRRRTSLRTSSVSPLPEEGSVDKKDPLWRSPLRQAVRYRYLPQPVGRARASTGR